MQTRRDFIKTAACTAGAITIGNSFGNSVSQTEVKHPVDDSSMMGYVAPKLDKVRVAVVGIGGRGIGAVYRLAKVPGVEITALCDLKEDRVLEGQKQLAEAGLPKAKSFVGEDGYKKLADSGVCDVIHINTNWTSHAKIALYALKAGVQAMLEVPGCRTIEEAWELVEASEKNKVNCCMLANCCYGEDELQLISMARKNIFGELLHAEGCYLHETRCTSYNQGFLSADTIFSSLAAMVDHTGAQYPIHALGPVSLALGINRGDRFDYLVSMGSKPYAWHEVARRAFGEDAKVSQIKFDVNDFNSTLINTINGRTILIRQCNTCPMPYYRVNTLYGFSGSIATNPLTVSLETTFNHGAGKWMNEEELKAIRTEHGSQLWKVAGEIAKKVGGHGGMDYMMDLRWSYCLRNGLPMDTNVYDLAAWSSVIELSERSVRNRSLPVDIPDFTRGKWKTNAPLGEWNIDLDKVGIEL